MYGFPQTGVPCTRNNYFSTLRISDGSWSLKRSSRARETPTFRKLCKTNVTPMAPAPSRAPPGQIHSGNPNAFLFGDPRPRPPANDYKCGDKSFFLGKVPCRARETLTFETLQNSKRGNCVLACTKTPTFEHPRNPNFHPSSRNLSE